MSTPVWLRCPESTSNYQTVGAKLDFISQFYKPLLFVDTPRCLVHSCHSKSKSAMGPWKTTAFQFEFFVSQLTYLPT